MRRTTVTCDRCAAEITEGAAVLTVEAGQGQRSLSVSGGKDL
jgi:hypothetical protein